MSPDTSLASSAPETMLQELTVLVPAGAEYKAVKKGLGRVKHSPSLIEVPAGQAVGEFVASLASSNKLETNVLLMGLGGGLSAECEVGRSLLLKQVWNAANDSTNGSEVLDCDAQLTAQVSEQLRVGVGVGVMCDRVVTSVQEKKDLGDRYQAQVVDMESFALLQALPQHNVAILRVISDSCDYDLPDISQAIRPDGSLNGGAMAISFAQRPIAAFRFINASLKGLSELETLTKKLFG